MLPTPLIMFWLDLLMLMTILGKLSQSIFLIKANLFVIHIVKTL